MHSSKTKKCIIILGYHRSGTSALAGALYCLGANLGSKYLVDLYENEVFVNMNAELLQKMNSDWDDVYPLPGKFWEQPHLKAYQEKIADLILKEFGNSQQLVLKDPRMCLLLPIYLPILKRLGIAPVFIIPLRDPYEVASSHEKRDGLSLEKSLMLWTKHILHAENDSRGFPRYFCYYNDLLQNPRRMIAEISHYLGVSFPRKIDEASDDLTNFLQLSKKHYNHEPSESLKAFPLPFATLYDHLFVNQNATFLGMDDQWLFDACREQFAKEQHFYLNTTDQITRSELNLHKQQLVRLIYELSRDLLENKFFDPAIKLLCGMTQIFPERHDFWNNLGCAYEAQGNDEMALTCFEQAHSLENEYDLALNNFHRVQERLENKGASFAD